MASWSFRVHKTSFPEFGEYTDRIKSYKTTPQGSYLREHYKKLAEAGFFHTGNEDEAICFYCGGGVKAWRPDDIPWVEHAKWLPGCAFLLVNKGIDFIKKHYEREGETDPEVKSIQTQKTDKPDLQCIVCLSNEKNVCFLPCRHCCVCSDCGEKLENCAVCREHIVSMMRIFLS